MTYLIRRVDRSGYYTEEEECGGWMIFCPACQCAHILDDKRWQWNDSWEKPSFTPSIKVRGVLGGNDKGVCHIVITDGILNFQADCTHAFTGKSVPMEPF